MFNHNYNTFIVIDFKPFRRMLNKEFVSYDIALKMKELGFLEDCMTCYTPDKRLINWWEDAEPVSNNDYHKGRPGLSPKYVACPLFQQAQRFLREVHGIHLVIIPTINCYWTYKSVSVISDIEVPPYKDVCGEDYPTYEAALEAGILKSLNLIK